MSDWIRHSFEEWAAKHVEYFDPKDGREIDGVWVYNERTAKLCWLAWQEADDKRDSP